MIFRGRCASGWLLTERMIWCLLTITIVGTGHPLPSDAGVYVNSIFTGPFVFHMFYLEDGQ